MIDSKNCVNDPVFFIRLLNDQSAPLCYDSMSDDKYINKSISQLRSFHNYNDSYRIVKDNYNPNFFNKDK